MAYLVFTVEYLADFSDFLQSEPNTLDHLDPKEKSRFDEYAPPQQRLVVPDSFALMKAEMQQLLRDKFEMVDKVQRLKSDYKSEFNTKAMAPDALPMKAPSVVNSVDLLVMEYSEDQMGNQAVPVFRGKVIMDDTALAWARTEHPSEEDPICAVAEPFFAKPNSATRQSDAPQNTAQQSIAPQVGLLFDPFFVWKVWESDDNPVINIPLSSPLRNGFGGGDR